MFIDVLDYHTQYVITSHISVVMLLHICDWASKIQQSWHKLYLITDEIVNISASTLSIDFLVDSL